MSALLLNRIIKWLLPTLYNIILFAIFQICTRFDFILSVSFSAYIISFLILLFYVIGPLLVAPVYYARCVKNRTKKYDSFTSFIPAYAAALLLIVLNATILDPWTPAKHLGIYTPAENFIEFWPAYIIIPCIVLFTATLLRATRRKGDSQNL